jgi:branched-subunit amino acid transport protein AzlD
MLATMLTRFIPFIIFPDHKPVPKLILNLADKLPYACLGMLLIYALKDTKLSVYPYGFAELSSLILITLVHFYKRNVLLSIACGVGLYLYLINVIFL